MMAATSSVSTYAGGIPDDIFDDLCSRFLINIPSEERNNLIRICFQIELAHWFYLDYYRPDNPQLPGINLKDFIKINADNVETVFSDWKQYKMSVPVFGAIVLNDTMEYVLLVQGFWSRASWGFPKGKMNKNEAPFDCAIREVDEETGFNIENYVKEERFITATFIEQTVRLYIAVGVPMDATFQPKTKGEIKNVKWFRVIDLPQTRRDNAPKTLGMVPNQFFTTIPFVKPLKKWIAAQRGESEPDEFALIGTESPLDQLKSGVEKSQELELVAARNRQQRAAAKQTKNETSSPTATNAMTPGTVKVATPGQAKVVTPGQVKVALTPGQVKVATPGQAKVASPAKAQAQKEELIKKQREQFAKQNNQIYNEIMSLKNTADDKTNRRGTARDRFKREPPPRFQRIQVKDSPTADQCDGLNESDNDNNRLPGNSDRLPGNSDSPPFDAGFQLFSAPSWVNFKLDTQQILAAFGI